MLKSMTAYAYAEQSDKTLTVCAEIRSYNSRYLDIALRLPAGYAALEEKIKSLISSKLVRGRVEVRLQIKESSEAACAYAIDLPKANAYYAAACRLKAVLKLKSTLSLDQLMAVPGVVQATENVHDADGRWTLIAACVQAALDDLDRMRQQEGAHIGEDFSQRLDRVAQDLQAIEKAAEGMPALYRDKLQARIETLTQGVVALDVTRLAQEAAILADRSDISEEIVRTQSHIVQFRDIMKGTEPAGRKLNFLLQEFNREFNTMGAKVGQAAIAHRVVALKAEIEKLREQVQNIE